MTRFTIVQAADSHQRPARANGTGTAVPSRDGEHRRHRSATIGCRIVAFET